jgi:hypothetical protein
VAKEEAALGDAPIIMLMMEFTTWHLLIEAHLRLGGKGGGGIRRCSDYHANEGIHNMASTSVVVNRVYSTQDQGK